MIRVRFVEPRLSRWVDWKRRCREQLRPYLARSRVRPKIDERLYKECSDLIFQGYANKCAYCEGKILIQTLPEVEHFRPKNGVRDIDNKIVNIGRKPHPGYWWLAYDPANLLPACPMCNRYTKKSGGKGERFPVSGFRATKPGDETKERPLLIHPGRRNPRRHFELDFATGMLSSRTKEGKASIKVFGLNREGLAEERLRAIQDATVYLKSTGAAERWRAQQHLAGLLSYSFVWRAVKAVTR
jgi:hypothetical protein